jgi:uncharacterized protein YjbI with pentapeptide repeats
MGVHVSQICISYRHTSLTGMDLSQAWISTGMYLSYVSYRRASPKHASLVSMLLSRVSISRRRASLVGVHLISVRLSQVYISHRDVCLISMHLSQAYFSCRHAYLIGMHLSQAYISY